MDGWQIALIVIGSLVIFIIIVYFFLKWYTWKKVTQNLDPSIPKVKVDPQEYSGRWFEIGRFTKWFEQGCNNSTATYTLNGTNTELKVLNRCFADGTWKESVGKAYPSHIDGVFGVSFFPGIYGNYTVTYRDTQTSIVTNQDRSNLWILSRTPTIKTEKKEKLVEWLRNQKFNTTNITWTPQLTAEEMLKSIS